MMRGILINPKNKTVEYVDSEFDNQQIKEILKADLLDFTARVFGPWTQTIVEDYSAYNPSLSRFYVHGYSYPISGLTLILGYDQAGETRSVGLTVDQVYNMIEFE